MNKISDQMIEINRIKFFTLSFFCNFMDLPNLEILIECNINFKPQVYNQVWYSTDKIQIISCTVRKTTFPGWKIGQARK